MLSLHYKVYGQGKPIIILHGMFGMLDNWQWVAKQLANEFMVFCVDLRNHGKSPHSDEFGYEIMSEDIYNFMQEHWIHKAVIIGHSMGGKVAMNFALDHEDMVEKLIVVDIAPIQYKGNHEEILDSLSALPIQQIESREEAQFFLRNRIKEESTIQFILKNLTRNTDGRYIWKMNLPVIQAHYQEILSHQPTHSKYEGPTLFIKGANSGYIETDKIENQVKDNFTHVKLSVIPNAGHWVHAENPELFCQVVKEFINLK